MVRKLLAVSLFLASAMPAMATDLLLDNFTDNNFIAESWGPGAWAGDTGTAGKGLDYRTREAFPIGLSSSQIQLTTISSNLVLQHGTTNTTPDFSVVSASDRTTGGNTQKLQAIGLNLVRASGYNATSHKYVRVTAWLTSPQAAWSTAATSVDSTFVVSMGGPTTATSAVGPWDATGTNLTGITLTTTPTVYFVPINETTPTRFKVDPIFTALGIGLTQLTDYTDVRSLQFLLRRGGVATAGTNQLGAQFFVDDVMFLDALPGVSYSGTANVTEGGAGSVVNVALKALPSHSVTLTFANTADYTVSPSSLTFTTANWATTQPLTITAVDDAVGNEAVQNLSQAPGKTTSDLWYGNNTLESVAVSITDNDIAPAQNTFSLAASEYTNSGTVSFAYTGSAGPATSIQVDEDSGFGSPTAITLPGTQNYTFDSTTNGVKTVYSRLVGPYGTSPSVSDTITLDTQAPVLGVTSLVTNVNTPSVSGTISDNIAVPASVSVTVDSNVYPATPSAGSWSAAVTATLADGVYNVSASATDLAGNTGSDVTVGELTVDTTAPALTVTPLSTNNQSPTLSGTISDALGVPSTVTVNVNGSNYTGTVSSGTWTANVTATLAEGTYPVTVTATDTAGNLGTDATTNELIIDTTAPSLTALDSDTANVKVGGTITGTYAVNEAGTQALYVRTIPGGTWAPAGVLGAAGSGTWSYTPTGDANLQFTVVGTDAVNNATVPTGTTPAAVSIDVAYNDVANSSFANTVAADGLYRFPMTESQVVTLQFTGITGSNPVTVSRNIPAAAAPAGFDPNRLIDENLNITGSFTGTATITWQTDPASDDLLASPLNTVFQFESGSLVNTYPVTPVGTTLTVGPVSTFSQWFAGNNAASVTDWTLLDN